MRAWRGLDRFEGRSAVRSWLYRIATNVCFDMLKGRQRRARPMDLGPARSADAPVGSTLPEATWVEPIPDGSVLPAGADPADVAVARDSVRLAFVATLQHLPPRQRAVLILREVLAGGPAEVAELLDTTVASVNSALQRARATLARRDLGRREAGLDDQQQALLERYVDAFERYDMDALTALLHEDATQSMPPYALWLRGREDILRFWLGQGAGCRGSRLVPTCRERLARVRPVQAERAGWGAPAVGAAGPADLRRPHRRADVLPVHRCAVPPLRASRDSRAGEPGTHLGYRASGEDPGPGHGGPGTAPREERRGRRSVCSPGGR